MTELRTVADDLVAEQQSLDEVVADLPAQAWHRATASQGWSVSDQIGHLAYFDGTAALAIDDEAAFRQSVDELLRSGGVDGDPTLGRDDPPAEVLERWRRNRSRLAASAATLVDGARVPWYGPSMSAKSFLTARLMECWAHGCDVVEAVGGQRPSTDRLRHIAQLGFITRGWSYANRGLEVPAETVRVEVSAPSGAIWTFGPERADAVVTGPAVDFCLVVTQRRHLDDTELTVDGDVGRDWLLKAQAFAGPPTDPPASRAA